MVLYSIVIVCRNEEKYIEETLTSCVSQTSKAHEIIVVDGNSSDNTTKVVKRFPQVKLISSTPHVGLQRRLGAEKSTGEYIVFLDADTKLPNNFIKNVNNLLKLFKYGLICPWYIPKHKNIVIHLIYIIFNLIFRLLWLIAPSGAGSCMVVNRKKYLSMPERIFKLRYDDIATIRYIARRSFANYSFLPVYVSERRFYERGVVRTFLKYLCLSFFFFFGWFKFAEIIPYSFNHEKSS